MIRAVLILLALAGPASAEMVVAARTIPAQSLIGPADLAIRDGQAPGSIADPRLAVGLEARVAIYAGRPVRADDLTQPALVDRNQVISLVYNHGGLFIATEGRALSRAGAGELIRVMNLSSRNTVNARIGADGAAYVAQ